LFAGLNNYYIATVELGEASAKLGNVLEALAIDIEKQQHFRAKVSAAMIYPAGSMEDEHRDLVYVHTQIIPKMK
jgi:hypothetical protein